MSTAIREAIRSKLITDGTLTGLATGGVFSDIPPPDSEVPYVIFSKMDGRYEHAFRAPSLNGQLYLVKGISRKKAEAEAIDSRCRIILNRTDLNIDGHETKSVLFDHDVDYPEKSDDGDRFEHVGTVYRIVTE